MSLAQTDFLPRPVLERRGYCPGLLDRIDEARQKPPREETVDHVIRVAKKNRWL